MGKLNQFFLAYLQPIDFEIMKKAIVICVLAVLAACSTKKEGNLVVNGQIKGLKKGTVYLQKIVDTVLVSVDSIQLLSTDTFTLTDHIDSPEMYYITLDGNNTTQSILFFAEEGIITVKDNLNSFGVEPTIEGSKNQKVMDDFLKMKNQFNNKKLDLIKAGFDAQKAENQKQSDSLVKETEKLLRRQYLFATNFAMNHGDYEAAPYIALTELVDANVRLLDTINSKLSERVKTSLYGKKLDEFIKDIKKNEQ